jgi:hypothetical protein
VAATLCLESCYGDQEPFYLGLILGLGGWGLGSALTIDWLGDRMDGRGEFGPTVLGSMLGLVGGLLAGIALAAGAGTAGIIPAFLGPAVGGVIAYEISDTNVTEAAAAATASRPRVAPLLTVSPRGGFIGGLVGSF